MSLWRFWSLLHVNWIRNGDSRAQWLWTSALRTWQNDASQNYVWYHLLHFQPLCHHPMCIPIKKLSSLTYNTSHLLKEQITQFIPVLNIYRYTKTHGLLDSFPYWKFWRLIAPKFNKFVSFNIRKLSYIAHFSVYKIPQRSIFTLHMCKSSWNYQKRLKLT